MEENLSISDLILDVPSSSGMSLGELLALSSFIWNVTPRPSRILEIGTKYGRTTINLAKFSPAYCNITSLDLVPLDYSVAKKYFCSAKINFIEGDSTKFDFSSLGKFDIVLVDANHEYDFVKNDTLKALSVLNTGGYILWHDYGKNERQYPAIRVKRALDDMKIVPQFVLAESLVGMKLCH